MWMVNIKEISAAIAERLMFFAFCSSEEDVDIRVPSAFSFGGFGYVCRTDSSEYKWPWLKFALPVDDKKKRSLFLVGWLSSILTKFC